MIRYSLLQFCWHFGSQNDDISTWKISVSKKRRFYFGRYLSAPTNIHHFSVSHILDALQITRALSTLYIYPKRNRLWPIGGVLILGSRLTWQAALLIPIYGDAALLSSPCFLFLTSPHMERARDHVTAARPRDPSPSIHGHVVALPGYTWPCDLISLGPGTCVCNGRNVYPIKHAQLCEPYHRVQLLDHGSQIEK